MFRSKRTPPPPPSIRGDVQKLRNTKNEEEVRILYEGPYHVVYDVVPKVNFSPKYVAKTLPHLSTYTV